MSGLIFAVESAENEIGADVSAEEVATLEATVADESTAIQAESNEADVTVTQVEAAVQDGEELEAIADVATDSLADGGEGLTEEAAEVAAIAIERARARLGFGDLSRITPAREQFGSSSTRQHATVMVVEGIKETIKNIWESIKRAAMRLWEKIKGFVAGLFKSVDQLKKLSESLRGRINKIPAGAKPIKPNLDSKTLAKSFGATDGVTPASVSAAFARTSELVRFTKDASKEAADIGLTLAKASSDIVSNPAKALTELLGARAALAKGVNKMKTLPISATQVHAAPPAKDETFTYYGPFAGNTVLRLSVKAVEGKEVASLKFLTTSLTNPTSVKALSREECSTVLKSVNDAIKELESTKSYQSTMNDIVKQIEKTANSIVSSVEEAERDKGTDISARRADAIGEMKKAATDLTGMLSLFGQKTPTLSFNLAKAGLDYVSMCVRNLSDKQ